MCKNTLRPGLPRGTCITLIFLRLCLTHVHIRTHPLPHTHTNGLPKEGSCNGYQGRGMQYLQKGAGGGGRGSILASGNKMPIMTMLKASDQGHETHLKITPLRIFLQQNSCFRCLLSHQLNVVDWAHSSN